MLYNPYRNYDKGMDDAYTGKEPSNNSASYMTGYERCIQLMQQEERQRELETHQTEQHEHTIQR